MNRSSPAEREHPQQESHPADADTLGVGMVPAGGWISDVLQEPTELPQQARIGPYELLGKLGTGGVATVYRARHCGDGGEDVALKLFEPAVQISQGQVALRHFFDRELRIASQLDHPHLVRILDSGMTAEGFVYLVMPLIDGMSLDSFVSQAALDYRCLAELLAQVCDGLTYLHSRGIVHRDLKPANILVTHDGHPYVTDLGVAWQELPSAPRTMTGYVMGTPGYLSPEQLNEQVGPVSSRTDVYGLGATLYCVLMGRPPFDRGQSVASVLDVLLVDPVRPRRQNRKIPRDLERICLKCLEKRPQDRYDSARALGDDLRRFAAHQRVKGRPRSAVTRLRRWAAAHPRHSASIAAGSLLLLISTWIAVDSWQQSRSAKARSAEHLELARQTVADASIALPQELPDSADTLKHRRTLLERGREGFRVLLDQEPDNPLIRRQAAVNLFLLGQVEYLQGDFEGSIASYTKALTLFQALARDFPEQQRWLFDCYQCCYGLHVGYSSLGMLAHTRPHLANMERLITQLVQLDATNGDYLDALANTLVAQAFRATEDDDLDTAEAYGHRARLIAQQLEPWTVEVPLYIRHQSSSAATLAEVRKRRGDLAGDLRWQDEAIEHARRMHERQPDNVRYELHLIGTMHGRLPILVADGQRDRALREARQIRQRLASLLESHQNDRHATDVLATIDELVAELSAEQAESVETHVVESGKMAVPGEK